MTVPQRVLQWRPTVEKVLTDNPLIASIEEVLAIMQKESDGEQYAVNPHDGPVGSFGLGQLEPPELKAYAGVATVPSRSLDPKARAQRPSYGFDTTHPAFDPVKNLTGLARYLSFLKARYATAWPLYLNGDVQQPNPRGWVGAYNLGMTHFDKGCTDLGYVSAVAANLQALQVT